MTISSATEREVLAPSSLDVAEISDLAQFLESSPRGQGRSIPYLSSPQGERHEIPAAIYDTLKYVVDALAAGQGVTIVPTSTQLTTQQAADHLHMSRPTLVKLLEQGDIPFTKVGRHRRVLLTDLMGYERNLAAAREDFLSRQTREAAHDGSYFSVPADHETL